MCHSRFINILNVEKFMNYKLEIFTNNEYCKVSFSLCSVGVNCLHRSCLRELLIR